MKIAKMPDGSPEIYLAKQGEGVTQGRPSIFVRSALCNLHCTWCDTAYTWNFLDTPFQHQSAPKYAKEMIILDMHEAQVAEVIKKYAKDAEAVVFTGGEPMLQQDKICAVIDDLMHTKCAEHLEFEIETNGTIMMSDDLAKRIDYVNCSPKLSSSGNAVPFRERPPVIANYFEMMGHYGFSLLFKFVITKDNFKPLEEGEERKTDMEEVQEWCETMGGVDKSRIWLMPEGVTVEKIEEGYKKLVETYKDAGYNITTRQHILDHGNKRAT